MVGILVSTDKILEDACNGGLKELKAKEPSCVETSRTAIQFEKYPGREMTISIPEKRGVYIMQAFLIDGQIYAISIVGNGLTRDHPNVKRLFESFARR